MYRIIISICFLTLCHAKISYNGYKLLRIHVNDKMDVDWLQSIADDQRIDIWSYPTKNNQHADVLVSPEFFLTFSKLLKSSDLYFYTIMTDVGRAIAKNEHKGKMRIRRHSRLGRRSIHFPLDDYHSFDDIENWLRQLNSTHSDRFSLSTMGRTAEGRQLWLVKISDPPNLNEQLVKKPAIFIDAGLHAREWISHATALYLIKELLHNTADSSILRKIDWYFVPVANPDGYVFSKNSDRLWRKSRSVYSRTRSSAYTSCKGVDINRNFDHHWGEAGANTLNPCSNIYAGPYAFSEIETEALASKLRRLAPTLKAYVSLHSYGQFWLVPWGYHSEKPDNYPHQSELAVKAMSALRRVNQTEYTFGTIADLMYPASGTSVDYAHSLGVPFTFALELRPEDSDQTHGFLYPAEFILPTGKETFEGLKSMAKEIINLYPN